LDLDSVLQLVLEQLAKVVPYDSMALWLRSGDTLYVAAARGFPDMDEILKLSVKAEDNRLFQAIEREKSPLVIADTHQDSRFLAMGETDYVRSWLGVPLVVKDRVIGTITIDKWELHFYHEKHAQMAVTFANQAAIAIQNARLYQAERKRAAQLAVVNQVARRVASILDMDQLLQEVVVAIQQGFNYYNVALSLLDQAAGKLEVLAIAGGFADLVSPSYRQAVGVGMVGGVAETGQPLLANDVSQEPRYILGFLKEPLTRSELCVPLKLAGQVIGVLDVQDTQLNAFDESDLLAMQTLADQIAVAIENARLYAAEHQQLHRLEELACASQRITADLDLAYVLEEVGAQALTTLEADRAAIFLLDWETDRLSCAYSSGLSPEYVNGVDRRHRESPGSNVLSFSEPIHVLDAQTDPAAEAPQELVVREGFHTFAVLPLTGKGKVVGALAIYRDAIRAFRPEVLALAQSFANQAAIAIENARLYQQTDEKLQTRVRELAALYAIAEIVNHSDLDAVLQLALDSATRLTGMDSGGILLLDPSTSEIFLRAHKGWPPGFIQAVRHTKADEGLMPRMLKSVLVVDDRSKLTKERRAAIKREGFQSVVSIPLKAMEKTLGVMAVTSHSPRTFVSEELELLAAIGNQVGIAVDRANLQAQELRAAILEERQDMAQQMHDDIAQTLGYLGLEVDSVMGSSSLAQNAKAQAELEGIRKAIEHAYERVHSSIMRLGEDIPAHFDLGAALPEIISEFEKQTGCRVESRIDKGQLLHLPPSVAFQATYIIREALTNVRKHSGADFVHLTLQGLEDGRVKVTIQDDGRGFDFDNDQQSGWRGFGLRFMRARAERVGGSLRIESGPGQGTRIVVTLPSG